MNFIFDKTNSVVFYTEQEAFSGVRKIADKVRKDVERALGVYPNTVSSKDGLGKFPVIYGTVGHSPILDGLASGGKIDLSAVRGKWEVFSFQLVESPFPGVECALVIAGSDKRGTIYGLFHLSELMGVSPLVDWADVQPVKREQVTLTADVNMASKTPSIKYRGFFINDEWPAFGNWTERHFNGFTADMYDHVFELLLRHKANYFWPAMWSACFSLDGPGLRSAELADEYGIVISTSHHEPCMRNGEEYRLMRGKNSIYGDAWNFRANREGIIKFWDDGLKRNGKFDNIITLGMRGERDSAILGREATREDNIALLKDVIKVQNQLIKENVNQDLTKVPRQLVMFSEIEGFFYNDENTTGLMDYEELDGVMFMLCDDNFGNVRSLPTEKMRTHNGGFGLYYHFDFHGGTYSYEWTNSTYLPKVWEQLTLAYEYGIHEAWIVNVGDIGMQEFPIAFFMDMAYDMDKWRTSPNSVSDFTKQWIKQQFSGVFGDDDLKVIKEIIEGYTRINHNRKPEIMNEDAYHPVHFGEAENLLKKADYITKQAEILKDKCPKDALAMFYELVYYPAVASANIAKMQVMSTRNELYAQQGRVEANDYADAIAECIATDRRLTEEYHTVGDGKWYGMGMSEHIGYTSWNDEGCRYPLMIKIEPANKPRIVIAPSDSVNYTLCEEWSGRPLFINKFMNQSVSEVNIDIACACKGDAEYVVTTDCEWLSLSREKGCVSADNKKDVLTVKIDRSKFSGMVTGEVLVKKDNAVIRLIFKAENADLNAFEPMTFLEAEGYVSIEAEHYSKKHDTDTGSFIKLNDYGRTLSGMKVMPPNIDFTGKAERPYLEYCFNADNDGIYEVDFYLAPSNTIYVDRKMIMGVQINDGEIRDLNTVTDKFEPINFRSEEWCYSANTNIRIYKNSVTCKKGVNRLRFYAGSPALLLEKIVLYPQGKTPPVSYLGAPESFYIK